MDALTRDMTVNIKVELDSAAAKTQLGVLGRDRTVKVKADVDKSSFDKIQKFLGKVDKKLGGISPIAGFAPAGVAALVPVIAAATAATAGLVGLFASAAVGAAGFAAVAIPAYTAITKVNTQLAAAQTRVNAATSPKAKHNALIAEAKLWRSLSPATLAAAEAQRDFSSSWKAFQASFQPQVFTIFGQGWKLLTDGLNVLRPIVAGVLPYVSQLLDAFRNTLPFWQGWAINMKQYIGPALLTVGLVIRNIAMGVGSLILAFAPFGARIGGTLRDMSLRFAEWAAHFGTSGAFRKFLDYVHANGPMVVDLLKNLGVALKNVGVAAALAGPGLLKVVVQVLTLVNNLFKAHPALANLLVQFTLWGLLIAKVAGALKVLTAISFVLTLGKWVVSLFGATGGFAKLAFNAKLAAATMGSGSGGFLSAGSKLVGFLGAAGPWGIAIGAAAAIVGGVFVASQRAAKKRVDELTGAIDKQSFAVTALGNREIAKALQDRGALKAANELGISVRDVTLAVQGNTAAMKRVQAAMDAVQGVQRSQIVGGKGAVVVLNDQQKAVNKLRSEIDKESIALGTKIKKTSDAIGRDHELAVAAGTAGGATSSLTIKTGVLNTAMGLTSQAAKNAARDLGAVYTATTLIPRSIVIQVRSNLAAAGFSSQAANTLSQLRGADGGYVNGSVLHRAGGGRIYGPGTAKSDSVPLLASNGEYVQSVAAVEKYGVKFMDALNRGLVPVGAAAGGGGTTVNLNARTVDVTSANIRPLVDASLLHSRLGRPR